mmetsp:Transcript_76786/g.178108  ORF Transcript_76786/g.178108 Transcript_76786/m.178108 type:complete len:204 (+) Transcript_76786:250-861(+)
MLSSSMNETSWRPSLSRVATIFFATSPGMCNEIQYLACLIVCVGFKQISNWLLSTGEMTFRTMGSCSPGSTLSSKGPGWLKPGPSTSNQPSFSAAGSSSTHSPPEGPVQVFPVVLTVEPTFRESLVILAAAGSAPSFLIKHPCRTRHSKAPAHAEVAATSEPSAASSGAAATGSALAAAAALGLMPTPALMSLRAFLAARLTS